jgi:hypothetical protein
VNEDRARDAVDHLQVAIREFIAAGQSFLSAFEDVVDRPDTRRDLLAAIETIAQRFVPSETTSSAKEEAEEKPAAGGDDNDDDGNFEQITVE